MKKSLSIAVIIGLIAVMLCFAACGGGGEVDDLSTTDGSMTSMLDEATTLMDEIEEGISDIMGDDERDEEVEEAIVMDEPKKSEPRRAPSKTVSAPVSSLSLSQTVICFSAISLLSQSDCVSHKSTIIGSMLFSAKIRSALSSSFIKST